MFFLLILMSVSSLRFKVENIEKNKIKIKSANSNINNQLFNFYFKWGPRKIKRN